jgi:hypothetical protein
MYKTEFIPQTDSKLSVKLLKDDKVVETFITTNHSFSSVLTVLRTYWLDKHELSLVRENLKPFIS